MLYSKLTQFRIYVCDICMCVDVYIYILFYILFHYGLSHDSEYSSLYYTVGPCYPSILYVVVYIY